MFKLDRQNARVLRAFMDARVRQHGCDNSHRFSRQWAGSQSVSWDDLLDILEHHGGFCDCEVVLNLPCDEDIGPVIDVGEAALKEGGPNPLATSSLFQLFRE